LANALLQFRDGLPQFPNLRILVLQPGLLLTKFLVLPLNGRQRHAVGIDRSDVLVVLAVQAEGGMEVLRDGAEVAAAHVVGVGPCLDGHRGKFVQHGLRIHGGEVLLDAAVAALGKRADEDKVARAAQAHEWVTATRVGEGVTMAAAAIPEELAARTEIGGQSLHADSVIGVMEIDHLAGLVAEVEAGVVVQTHAA